MRTRPSTLLAAMQTPRPLFVLVLGSCERARFMMREET